MALPPKPDLGTLRAELLARLGFGAQGAGAGNIIRIADSALQRAQEYLYYEYQFNELRQIYDYTTRAGVTRYEYKSDMHRDHIREIRVLYNEIWHRLDEGIEYYHDTIADTRYYPRRYDRLDYIEIWPQPDAEYTMRVEHYQRLGRFTQDTDRCTLDEYLVFNLALGSVKEHYDHDDAQVYLSEVEKNLRRRRRRVHGNKRYVVGKIQDAPMPRPTVVDYV